MSQGMHGGLAGKARKNHSKSRAQRMYSQQWIEELLEPSAGEVSPDRIIPVKPIEAVSDDSRYAYEFVAAAQDEVARSAEAERFAETVGATCDSVEHSSMDQVSPLFARTLNAAPAATDSVLLAHTVNPPKDEIAEVGRKRSTTSSKLNPAPAESQPSKRNDWSGRVQPRLFTMRRRKKRLLPEITWSGALTGILIGGAAGTAVLGLLSLVI